VSYWCPSPHYWCLMNKPFLICKAHGFSNWHSTWQAKSLVQQHRYCFVWLVWFSLLLFYGLGVFWVCYRVLSRGRNGDGLKLETILPQPCKCWDYRHVTTIPAS
jgi:hypothetical protein